MPSKEAGSAEFSESSFHRFNPNEAPLCLPHLRHRHRLPPMVQRVSEERSDRPFASVNTRALVHGNLRIVHPQNRSAPRPEPNVGFVSGMIPAVLAGLIAW